jgi:ATP-binding cassette, subfamily B, bacterial PglK
MKELFKILGKRKTNHSFFLILILFISGLFEVFSISLIIPLIDVLGNSNFELYPDYLIKIIDILQIDNYKTLVKYVFTLIIAVFFFRFIFFLSADFLKVNFAASVRKQLQIKLFSNYVKSDFSFFLKNRVSDLIKNLINETLIYSDKYIFAILNIITDTLTLILLITLLLFYNYLATSTVIFFVGFLVLIYFKFSNVKIKELSGKREEDERKLFQLYNESFNNLKDINIYNLHDLIIKKTQPIISSFNDNYKKLYRFQVAARPLLEIFLILFFLIFAFISIFLFNNESSKIISTFALFGAAAFRIIPASSRLLNYMQDIKFSLSAKKIIEKDILYFNKNLNLNKKILFNKDKDVFNEIKLENLNFNYGEKEIFKDLNFTIKNKKTIGIIGPSGSGKSTLLNIILSLLVPQKGNISYIINNKKDNSLNYSNLFSYVPQDIFLLDDSIISNIVFGKKFDENIDHGKIQKILDMVELTNFIDDKKYGFNSSIGDKAKNISGGQAQRISLARALYYDSEILILDEFSNQLDETTENNILKIIANLKELKTIIIVSHKKNVTNICDEIYKIENKRLLKI